MKRTIILLLVLLVSACGGDSDADNIATAEPPAATDPAPQPATTTAPQPATATPEQSADAVPALPLTGNGEQIVARVNEQPITLIEFQRAVDRFHIDDISSYDSIARRELDKLIEQAVMNQQAEELGITVRSEEVDAEYQAMRQMMPDDEQWAQWLADNRFQSEAEFRLATAEALLTVRLQEYVVNIDALTVPQVKARHILLPSQEAAVQVYERLNAGEDFTELARALSLDETTRDSGGDLGIDGDWIVPDDLIVPEIAQIALAQSVGQHSQPIRTALGWHIIQTLDISQRDAAPAEIAAESARRFSEWLQEQIESADIELFI